VTKEAIREMWEASLRVATRVAEGEMNQRSNVSSLSWHEVFEDEYEMDVRFEAITPSETEVRNDSNPI
jgi:hypothetical protein